MVVINTAQQKLIDALWAAKQQYDLDDKELVEYFAQERNRRKSGLREMVAEAMAAGIPTRQIHQAGLGMKQVASMHNFLGESGITNEVLLGLVMPKAAPLGVVPVAMPTVNVEPFVEYVGKEIAWTRRDGTKHTVPIFAEAIDVYYTIGDMAEEDMLIIDSHERKRVLFGNAEIEAYAEGKHPARWANK